LMEHENQNTFAVSTRPEHLARYNPLWVGKNGLWSGIGKTPQHNTDIPAHFLGVHTLSAEAMSLIQGTRFKVESTDLFNGIYRPLSNEGFKFKAVNYFEKSGISEKEFWFDMTTQEFLLEAQRHVLDTLARSTQWSEVLKVRYPEIKELEPGIWVRSPAFKGQNVRFHSPAIYVDTASTLQNKQIGPLVLGPNASLIHERGLFEISQDLNPSEISNSVVFTGNQSQARLPQRVQDRIVVI